MIVKFQPIHLALIILIAISLTSAGAYCAENDTGETIAVTPTQQSQHFQQLLSDSLEGAMQGESRYIGNVRFTDNTALEQVNFVADQMLVKSTGAGQYELMIASGKPAHFSQSAVKSGVSYQVSADNIEFRLNPNRLIAKGNAQFIQITEKGNKILVAGNEITLTSHGPESQSIVAAGKPLQFEHWVNNERKIKATGIDLEYSSQAQKLNLKGQVVVNQGSRRMSAGEIYYDGIKGSVSVPRIPNQQLEIIQQPVKSNEQKENP